MTEPVIEPPVRAAPTDRAVIRGVAATSLGTWSGQALSWVSTFWVARLLNPSDYGIVAMGAVFVGLVSMINEFGIGFGIIRQQALPPDAVRKVAGMSLLFGVAGAAVVLVGAWPVARFYRTPELVPVIAAQALSLLVSSIRTVPLALLRRDLDFKAAAANDFWAVAILAVVMVVLAMNGFGYWTLIIGSLVSSVVTTILALRRRPVRPAWPRFDEVREMASFGAHIVAQRVSWYFYDNADLMVAGRVFGKVSAGAYSFGWALVTSPIEKLAALVPKVATPVFAAQQNNPAGLRRFFLLATEGLSLAAFPAAAGLYLVSSDLVNGLLGTKWAAAIGPMRALAALAALRAIAPVYSPLLNMTGSESIVTRNGMRAAVLMPIAFVIGSRWGLSGIAWAWVVGYPIVLAPLLRQALITTQMRLGGYLAVLRPAVFATTVMALVIATAQSQMESISPVARLVAAVAIGATTYPLVLAIGFRPRVVTIVSGLRAALGREG